METKVSAELFERASKVTPGGVNSPVRAFKSVGGTPRFISRASGPYVYDADGNRYVDLVGSWGPMLLGHSHPEVLAAVGRAAANGTSFGAPTLNEVELAEEIVGRTPVEQVRLVNSGTEATMSVVRLARGVTGRDLVVKFAGCYHGHHDALLASAGSGLATLGIPGTPGVTAATTADTIVLEYNNFEAVSEVFAEHGDKIACIITEGAPGNMGVVPPAEGFNAHLLKTANEHGALFISDEVMTGFRVTRSGHYGIDGVAPDLMTFGKVMGGGFPAAAFGGSAELMGHLAPNGEVYQAGTLSGNPVATIAGLTTLRLATEQVYAHLDAQSEKLRGEVAAALDEAGVRYVINRDANMFSVFFVPDGVEQITNYTEAQQLLPERYKAFFHSMLESGIYLPPSGFEAWFLSNSHDDAALGRIVEALPAAARAAAAV